MDAVDHPAGQDDVVQECDLESFFHVFEFFVDFDIMFWGFDADRTVVDCDDTRCIERYR